MWKNLTAKSRFSSQFSHCFLLAFTVEKGQTSSANNRKTVTRLRSAMGCNTIEWKNNGCSNTWHYLVSYSGHIIDSRNEHVCWLHNVYNTRHSAFWRGSRVSKSKSKCLIWKGQYSPLSAISLLSKAKAQPNICHGKLKELRSPLGG